MKLFLLLLVTSISILNAQYVYGRAIYLGGDVAYAKPYLTEEFSKDVQSDYNGDSRSFGGEIVYAHNERNYLSLEFKQRSITVKHNSPFFIYSNEETIPTQSTTVEYNLTRVQYFHFFRRTSIFVGGGLEVANATNSNFKDVYDNRLSGTLNFGIRYGTKRTLILPYVGYTSPINSYRTDGQHDLFLSEFRIGMKLWVKIF